MPATVRFNGPLHGKGTGAGTLKKAPHLPRKSGLRGTGTACRDGGPRAMLERYFIGRVLLVSLYVIPAFTLAMVLLHIGEFTRHTGSGVLTIGYLFEIIALFMPIILYLTLPLSMALSLGIVLFRSIRSGEFQVLAAAGLSNTRTACIGLVPGTIFMVVCAILALWVTPVSVKSLMERTFLLRNSFSFEALQPNSVNAIHENITLYLGARTGPAAYSRVVIRDQRDPDEVRTIVAGEVHMTRDGGVPLIMMRNGVIYSTDRATGKIEESTFTVSAYRPDSRTPAQLLRQRPPGHFEYSILDLLDPPTSLKSKKARNAWIAEGHRRLTMPFLCITYALVLMALISVRVHRSDGFIKVFALSTMAIGVVHLGYLLSLSLPGSTGVPALMVVPYLLVLVPAVLAAWVIWRADRELIMLDVDRISERIDEKASLAGTRLAGTRLRLSEVLRRNDF